MPARVVLICHAATAATRQVRFAAAEPIEAAGAVRAAARAHALAGAMTTRPPQLALTSPALVARQTAELLGLRADIDPQLRDLDMGGWRGQLLADVHKSSPDDLARWLSDPAASPHGGESLNNLTERVAGWLESQRYGDRRVVAVTHPAIIRAAIVTALGAPPQSIWRIDVTPLSRTELSGHDGRWNLRSFDRDDD